MSARASHAKSVRTRRARGGGAGAAVLWLLAAVTPAAGAQPPAAPIAGVFLEAERAYQANNMSLSGALFGEIVRQDRNQPHAWSRLAEIHRREGRLDQALEAWSEVLRIYPSPDVAPHAPDAIRKARVGRFRLYVLLAAAELESARRSPGSSSSADQQMRLREALAPALRAAGELSLEDEFRQMIAQPRTSGGRTSAVVEIDQKSGEGKPAARPARSRAPIIVGDSEQPQR